MPESAGGLSSGSARPRPGGRSARVIDTVLRATLETFAEGGWPAVQVDAIAQRAGVHKTTIYRRWPTRGALVAAALAATPFRPHGATSPDTGSVRGDLQTLADDIESVLAVPRTRKIVRSLLLAAAEPELAYARQAFWTTRIDVTSAVITRGIERGEVPDHIDAELIATLFVGSVALHAVERKMDPPHAWFVGLVDATLCAANVGLAT